MTNKKTKEAPVVKKNNGVLSKLLLLIIFVFIGVIYLVLQNNPDLMQNTYSQKDDDLVTDALEKPYSAGAEPPVQVVKDESMDTADTSEEENNSDQSKSPEGASDHFPTQMENKEEVEVIESEEISSPYEEIIEKESSAFNSSALKNKFNNYRIFISNADMLIEKYKANENYEAELNIFQEQIHPPHINEIVKLLEDYQNVKRASKASVELDLDQSFYKFLKKFIKIKKIDSPGGIEVKIKENIDERLVILNNYIYSQNLQDNLIK